MFRILCKNLVCNVYTTYYPGIPSPGAKRRPKARGPEGEGANIDRRLVPYHAKCMRIQSHIEFIYPLARREAPAEGRRPEGANIDRRLVPYHAKCMRIQSRIEFIYIFICINGRPFCDGVRRLGTG